MGYSFGIANSVTAVQIEKGCYIVGQRNSKTAIAGEWGKIAMINVLFVGLGGFIGAVCRYLASLGVQQLLGEKTPWMPVGTLAVNVVGCFVIGLLEGLAANRALFEDEMRLLIFVGVLGGFTTFSAFGFEAYTLLDNKQPGAALAHVGLHLVAGLGAVYLGILVSRIGQ